MATSIDEARRRRGGGQSGTRVPPHNLQAEESLLGAMLLRPDAIVAALEAQLTPEDFYRPANGYVFEAITATHALGHPADAVTISEWLRRAGHLDDIGGPATLITLQAGTPAIGNAPRYARIVAEHSLLRRFIGAAAEAAEIGYDQPADVNAAIEAVTERFAALRARSDEMGGGTSWTTMDLAAAVAGEYAGDQPLYMARSDGERLLYPGKIHAFNAEPEAGKSLLAQWVAVEVLDAGEHVLYIDFEAGPVDVVRRLMDMGADADAILERFHYVRPDDAIDEEARRRISEMLRTWPVTFCVIDGVAEALALSAWEENSATDIISFYVALPRLISRAGVCVVLIDHVVKDKENQGRYARGTGAKLAGIDGATFKLEVVKPFGRGLHGIARLVVTKDRHGWVRRVAAGGTLAAEFHGMSDPASGEFTVELRPSAAVDPVGNFRPTVLMERVSRLLEGSTQPVPIAWVERNVSGNARHVRLALAALVAEEYVTTEKGPRGAVLHTLVHPYRAEPEAGFAPEPPDDYQTDELDFDPYDSHDQEY